jgi:hypothetical protein
MKIRHPLWFIAFVGLGTAGQVVAHHAFSAEFDANKPLTLTGTVTKVEWQNPHTWFYIDVAQASGNVASWGMELASPNILMRKGWTRSSMQVGDVVTVEGFQAKNGSQNGNARIVTLQATGERLFAGSTGGRRER